MPQYQGVWTLEQQAQAQSNQQWVTDPNFKNTTLLLQADGTGSGSQNNTFLDGSTNNFFITRNGNTTQGSFSPFSQAPGYWGNYFPASALGVSTAQSQLAMGSGSFTLEYWFNSGSTTNTRAFGNGQGGSFAANRWVVAYNNTAGKVELYVYNYSSSIAILSSTSTTITSDNAWHHVAIVRSGNTWAMFIDGTRQGTSVTSSASLDGGTSETFFISGSNITGDTSYTGYLSNVRFTKGGALYDPTQTTISVPTSPLTTTVSAGTVSVLTCQSNRFVDNSANNFSLTVYVTPSVQAFGPFAPALQWTPDVVGGSGYFDGTGDYLTSTITAFGSGNFTIQCWVYLNTSVASKGIFHVATSSALPSTVTGVALASGASGGWTLYYNNGSQNTNTTLTAALNTWIHLAVVKSGSTIYVYVNGVLNQSQADTANYTNQVAAIGGFYSTAYLMTGYMSGFKITNTADYSGTSTTTANFTLPTAPPSPTSSILCLNFTNAGIYDGKMANNLETVGNAQVSTSVVKYGSGSMQFNGTTDYLQIPDSELFNLRGDFTIEFWMNPTATVPAAQGRIYSHQQASVGTFLIAQHTTGAIRNTIQNSAGTTLLTQDTTVAPPAGVWTHIAYVRFGNVFTFYVNGVANISTTAAITIPNMSNAVTIGANISSTPTAFYNGYLDDYRVTQGVARYLTNFTPPQQALPRQ